MVTVLNTDFCNSWKISKAAYLSNRRVEGIIYCNVLTGLANFDIQQFILDTDALKWG
jgi:hypothetical protein